MQKEYSVVIAVLVGSVAGMAFALSGGRWCESPHKCGKWTKRLGGYLSASHGPDEKLTMDRN